MRMLCLWGRNGDLNLRATTTQLYGVVYLITVGLYKGGALSTLVATVLIGLGLLLTMVVDTIIHLKHERARKDRKVHRVRKHR